jgi:hypothetical protein
MKRILLFVFLAAQVPLFPQNVPWHRKKSGTEPENAPIQTSAGTLSKVDDKSIVVEIEDGRIVTFKRTEKTAFIREGQTAKPEDFHQGDQVLVEATADDYGYLYAQKVTLEPPAPKAESTPAAGQAPEAEPPAKASGRGAGNIAAPEDSDSPPPPRLARGKPAPRPDEELPDAAAPAAAPASSPDAPAEAAAPDATGDPLIDKARETTYRYTQKLPNYVCKEFMTRYNGQGKPIDWKPLDVVSTDIVYEGGRESYKEVMVDGKAIHKPIEEMGGAWSTGEFASMLYDVLAPQTAAEFHLRRQATVDGVETRVYNFEVERERSHWKVVAVSQALNPAFRGSVWIVPATGQVLRLEIQARELPKEFPLDTVESAVDYDNVMIGGQKFLLPVHAETLGCQRGASHCNRNVIDFRNYHKFEGSSEITFGK